MEFYSVIAYGYNELYGEEQGKKLKIIKENLNVNGLILDIGSGTGLSKKFFDDIICVDKTFEMLGNGGICAKAENLPFKDKSFDVVICVTVLQNVDNLNKAIKEIKRVAKNKIAFSILKKSNKFEKIKVLLNKNFNLREIDENKDLILIGRI